MANVTLTAPAVEARTDSDSSASSDPSLDNSRDESSTDDGYTAWRTPALLEQRVDKEAFRTIAVLVDYAEDLPDRRCYAETRARSDVDWRLRDNSSGEADSVLSEPAPLEGKCASGVESAQAAEDDASGEPDLKDSLDCGNRVIGETASQSSDEEDVVVYDPWARRAGNTKERSRLPKSRSRTWSEGSGVFHPSEETLARGEPSQQSLLDLPITDEIDRQNANKIRDVFLIRQEDADHSDYCCGRSPLNAYPHQLILRPLTIHRLPPSIRRRVLTLLLTTPAPLNPFDLQPIHHPQHIYAPILRTCRLFHAEGTPLLYQHNTFRFDTHTQLTHWLSFSPPTSSAPQPPHHTIRHIELKAYAFVWFTTVLQPGPGPHLLWTQALPTADQPSSAQLTPLRWDLRDIESLTVDFWVMEAGWEGIFNAFLPSSGLHVLRTSGFRPRRVVLRTYGEMFEGVAREIGRALVEGEGPSGLICMERL